MELLVRCVLFIFVNLNIYLLFILASNYPSKEIIVYKPFRLQHSECLNPCINLRKLAKQYIQYCKEYFTYFYGMKISFLRNESIF